MIGQIFGSLGGLVKSYIDAKTAIKSRKLKSKEAIYDKYDSYCAMSLFSFFTTKPNFISFSIALATYVEFGLPLQ